MIEIWVGDRQIHCCKEEKNICKSRQKGKEDKEKQARKDKEQEDNDANLKSIE